MLNKKKGKDIRLRHKNIFNCCTIDDLQITDHFFERWNERVERLKFDNKEELELYIKRNFNRKKVEHLYGDHYLLEPIMGGIYVTANKDENSIVLITTLGTYLDNPVMYNIIKSGELNRTIKRYGKINLGYAC